MAGVPSRSGPGVVSQACWWRSLDMQSDETTARRVLVLTLLVAVAAAALSSLYLARRKKTALLQRQLPAQLPPGPRGLPLLGSLPFLGPNLQRSFADLAKTYGPVMGIRLGTKLCVVVSSPAAAKEVLKDHDAVLAYRDVPAVAKVSSYGGRGIAWNNEPSSWRALRKISARELLNSTTMNAFYGLRRSEVRRMAREIYRQRGTPVQVGEESFLALLDVTSNMLWGSTVDGEERANGVGKEFRKVIEELAELFGAPNVSDFIPALARFDLQKVERRMKRLRDWYDQILNKVIAMHVKGAGNGGAAEGQRAIDGGRGKDFLQVLLNVLESGADANYLTVDHIKAVLLDLVTGGTDTSATTAEWAMAEMMRNPAILRRAQVELDAVVEKDAVVEEFHIPRLRYLDAVAKETLRLHPVVPLLVPRCASAPCMIRGHYVPAGTKVLVNVWAIHRDLSAWEEPLEFKPERFLVDRTKWDYHAGGGDFRFLPFGSGRRICAGIAMGERMTMFLLATLMHSFDWELPVGAKVDMTESLGLVLKMATPLTVIPTPRFSNLQLYT